MAVRPRATRKLQPMKVSEGFRAVVRDPFEELGAVTSRPLFGGVGLYHDGLFFGILAGDVLYLKVDDRTRGDYVEAGTAPFKPYAGRPVTMHYYGVPAAVLESPPELARWARKAIAVAARAASAGRGTR